MNAQLAKPWVETLEKRQLLAATIFDVDFGDAPLLEPGPTYPVTIEQDGARHLVSELFLGSMVDAEADGVPTSDNDAGDNAVGVDEDGVTLVSTIYSVSEETASSLLVTTSRAARLDAWIDFNRDGDWQDAGEQILTSVPVDHGPHVVPFDVPAESTPGDTALRVRVSSEGGLSPTGYAANGEVEDYVITIATTDQPIEIHAPFEGSGLTFDCSGDQWIIRQNGETLAELPKSLLDVQTIVGTAEDDTIILDPSWQGELPITADGGAGTDRIVFPTADQSLDLINSDLRNIEIIDLRGNGANSMQLNPDAIRQITDDDNTLFVYCDWGDEAELGEEWNVGPPIVIDGHAFHVLTYQDLTVYVMADVHWSNPINPYDVNCSESVSALDALSVMNFIMRADQPQLDDPIALAEAGEPYVDVNNSATATALDALLVINKIGQQYLLASTTTTTAVAQPLIAPPPAEGVKLATSSVAAEPEITSEPPLVADFGQPVDPEAAEAADVVLAEFGAGQAEESEVDATLEGNGLAGGP